MKRSMWVALSLLLLVFRLEAAPKPGATPKKPVTTPQPKPKPVPYAKPTPKPTPLPPVPTATPLPTPTPIPVAVGPKTWAVLVGISEYQSPNVSKLNFAAKDATALRDALVDPAICGVPSGQVLLLTDAEATRDKISGSVNTFLRPHVQSGDRVMVFLAGHGVAKGVGAKAHGYLLPTDVRGLSSEALENSAVSLRSLADDLATLPASQFVVFVDACREDPSPGRGVKGNSMSDVLARGITVVPKDATAQSATFFACSIGERAFEDAQYGHGVFTNWILQGLQRGAIAQKTDGAVDMGRLSSYVESNVAQWAKESSSADFERSQTPQLVAAPLSGPLVLLNVKRPVTDAPIEPSAPELLVTASPETAQIAINGANAGVGTAEKSLNSEGDVSISVSAPGYAPQTRTVKALGGYEQQIVVQLQPKGGAGTTSPAQDRVADFYARAVEAQAHEQFEVAEQGYSAALGADPRFVPAYEALFGLHQLQGRNTDALADALKMVANTPRSAHSLSFLSRAYREVAVKGAGQDNALADVPAVGGYSVPKKPDDAAKMAVRAASEAVALDGNSPEANLSQGYALAALDVKGKNKRPAMAAFGKAAFLDASDAENHLGLGYGIRFYAMQLKKEDERRGELNRAVTTLNQAVKLRPNFYEAHRELAFCLIALGDTEGALKECKLARANRGAANDPNEIAGVEVAMAGLHEQIAQNSTGDKKTDNEAASQGYMSDAKETTPDLKVAMSILNSAGISTALSSYLPTELLPLLDLRSALEDKARGAIPIPIPGLPHF